jgi:hypothetical protein
MGDPADCACDQAAPGNGGPLIKIHREDAKDAKLREEKTEFDFNFAQLRVLRVFAVNLFSNARS